MVTCQYRREWSLARQPSCSPAGFAIACAGLSVIPTAFATLMHAMNGCTVFYLVALLHAGVIWSSYFYFARHALDGELVVLENEVLTIETSRGLRRSAFQFNTRWAVMSISERRGITHLSVHSSGCTVQIGRHAPSGALLRFVAEFKEASACEVTISEPKLVTVEPQ